MRVAAELSSPALSLVAFEIALDSLGLPDTNVALDDASIELLDIGSAALQGFAFALLPAVAALREVVLAQFGTVAMLLAVDDREVQFD